MAQWRALAFAALDGSGPVPGVAEASAMQEDNGDAAASQGGGTMSVRGPLIAGQEVMHC